jgi:hypothetical protein
MGLLPWDKDQQQARVDRKKELEKKEKEAEKAIDECITSQDRLAQVINELRRKSNVG